MQAQRFDLAIQMHGSGEISNGIVANFGARRTAGFGAAPVAGLESGGCPFPAAGAEPLRLLRLTDWLGAPAVGAHLEFPLGADDERELRASGIGADLAPGSCLCIHPGARTRDKCWPPGLFAAVADRLTGEFGLRVVLTGSAAEADLTAAVAHAMRHPAIDAAAPISIGAMAALMRRARLLVCNDTGVSHIAAGLKLPSVAIFSKADLQRWAPLDRTLHRCLWDPDGLQAPAVLQHARSLLAGAAPRRDATSGPRAAVPAPSW
jgi:ADP-heptose:LPS heptosyltransferase